MYVFDGSQKEDNLAPRRYLVIYRNTLSCHTWVRGEQGDHSWNLVRKSPWMLLKILQCKRTAPTKE